MATNTEQQAFINTIAPLAVADWQKHRILPSLTIAQAIQETGYGTSELAKNANNYFGIKGGDSRWSGPVYIKDAGEFQNGVPITVPGTKWRKYASMAESVSDHGAFLQQSHYSAVVGERDYMKACKAIKAAGYATGPTYDQSLIDRINEHNLTQFDALDSTAESGYAVPIRVLETPAAKYSIKCPYTMQGKGVVFHNTAGNRSAMEEANDRLFGSKAAAESSIHLFVDENEAVNCSPLDRNTWHAHDGGSGYANRNLWSIEVCRSYGSGTDKPLTAAQKATFLKAERNAAWIVAWLFKKYGLPANKNTIRWHYEFASTACPHRTKEYGLDRIIPMVQGFLDEMNGNHAPTEPAQPGEKEFDKMLLQSFGSKNMQGFSRCNTDGQFLVYDKMPTGYREVSKAGLTGEGDSWQWVAVKDERTGATIYTPLLDDRNKLFDDAPLLLPAQAATGGVSQGELDAANSRAAAAEKRASEATAINLDYATKIAQIYELSKPKEG